MRLATLPANWRARPPPVVLSARPANVDAFPNLSAREKATAFVTPRITAITARGQRGAQHRGDRDRRTNEREPYKLKAHDSDHRKEHPQQRGEIQRHPEEAAICRVDVARLLLLLDIASEEG